LIVVDAARIRTAVRDSGGDPDVPRGCDGVVYGVIVETMPGMQTIFGATSSQRINLSWRSRLEAAMTIDRAGPLLNGRRSAS
jgi:hypothetical protein